MFFRENLPTEQKRSSKLIPEHKYLQRRFKILAKVIERKEFNSYNQKIIVNTLLDLAGVKAEYIENKDFDMQTFIRKMFHFFDSNRYMHIWWLLSDKKNEFSKDVSCLEQCLDLALEEAGDESALYCACANLPRLSKRDRKKLYSRYKERFDDIFFNNGDKIKISENRIGYFVEKISQLAKTIHTPNHILEDGKDFQSIVGGLEKEIDEEKVKVKEEEQSEVFILIYDRLLDIIELLKMLNNRFIEYRNYISIMAKIKLMVKKTFSHISK